MAFSQQIITDLTTAKNTARNTGFSSVTTANAISAAGPIEDMVGMAENVLLKAQELRQNIQSMILNIDSGTDAAQLALYQNVLNDLV